MVKDKYKKMWNKIPERKRFFIFGIFFVGISLLYAFLIDLIPVQNYSNIFGWVVWIPSIPMWILCIVGFGGIYLSIDYPKEEYISPPNRPNILVRDYLKQQKGGLNSSQP
jgi:hypothetical protein